MNGARCAVSLLWFATLATIGGCAQFPFFADPRLEEGSPAGFEMLGRVYVRFGQRAFAGSLRWQHAREADEVWLSGPLGQGAAHILRDASGATLTGADQQTFRATSLARLTQDGLGWTLPLADLSYYVSGAVPGAAMASVRRDEIGRIESAQHDGWSVRWVHREDQASTAPPSRIELRRDDVEIRLVIDRLEPSSH